MGPELLAAAGLAATAASAGAGILGAKNQAQAATQQADSQARALELKAAADRVQASNEAAYQQRQAINERRKTDLALSQTQALAAKQGSSAATDPSTLELTQDIAGQGEYNALSAIAAGRTKEAALNYQADIDLFNAGRYRQAGPVAARGAIYSGLGQLAGLAGTTADRYYRYKFPLGTSSVAP
jgi:glutamine synthetase adenylyltransferase